MVKTIKDKCRCLENAEDVAVVLRCGGCRWYAEEDEDSPPYCMARDVYTFVKGTDRACSDFEGRTGMT